MLSNNMLPATPGREEAIPGFKPKPELPCPAHGLVYNKTSMAVYVWNDAARNAGDILEAYDERAHPLPGNQVVSPEVRAAGLRVALSVYPGLAAPVAPPPAAVVQPMTPVYAGIPEVPNYGFSAPTSAHALLGS